MSFENPRNPDQESAVSPEVQQILENYGDVLIKNPHYGTPGHEQDDPVLSVSDAPRLCPPFIEALIRAGTKEQQAKIIEIYKAE